ncbi:MAG TPA: hypothetical protein VNV86_22495 [Candidatus Acidoferrum sp.]|nr:hypothetical protein [Candidatus Acidoferrum sp.]
MRRRWILAVAPLALVGCGPSAPPPVASAVPADTTAVVSVDLAALRAAPAYSKLPPAIRAFTDPLPATKLLVLAWNGKELLMLAGGGFTQTPSGYTSIGNGIAASGSPERVEAARKKLAAGSGIPLALPQGNAEIRATLRGDGGLPLAGNLANAANLLRMANPTTVTVHVENAVEAEITAQCGSSADAVQLEESLRALLTLAKAGNRDADLAAMLADIRTSRENRLVRTQAVLTPETLAKAIATR